MKGVSREMEQPTVEAGTFPEGRGRRLTFRHGAISGLERAAVPGVFLERKAGLAPSARRKGLQRQKCLTARTEAQELCGP